jgi:hypothetical protein
MEYRSPVRLVSHAAEPITEFTQQAIQRTKKKLLAEMSLQDHQIILDDVLYTRNDVIVLLDSITTDDTWRQHCIIYAHESFLALLEKGEFNPVDFQKAGQYRYNPHFVAFVSPYFASSFGTVSGKMIREKKFSSLTALLDYQSFMLAEHHDAAYQRIRVYLEEVSYLLRNLSWEKFREDESILHFIFDSQWVAFLNALPDSFATTRDEVVGHLLGVVYRFQRKASWYYLHQCCTRILGIECSESSKEEVKRYEAVMRQNTFRETSKSDSGSGSGSDGPSAGRIIFFSIWLVFIILRLSSNGCGRSSSPSYERFDYSPYEQQAGVNRNTFFTELNSSGNEKNFKTMLAGLKVNRNSGELAQIKTGATPFYRVSKLPEYDGDGATTIVNTTGYDAVMFYFNNSNPLLDHSSRIYAVYIRKGERYSFNLRPGFGRLNFSFGKQWLLLNTPKNFLLRTFVDNGNNVNPEGDAVASMEITGYFQTEPGLDQYLLKHDITVTGIQETNTGVKGAPKLLSKPRVSGNKTINEVELKLVETAKGIRVESKGDLYVYER